MKIQDLLRKDVMLLDLQATEKNSYHRRDD